jgi:hypothetical protein
VFSSYIDPYHRARLTVLRYGAMHTVVIGGSHALPKGLFLLVAFVSLMLHRIAVGLRLGVKVCGAQTGLCGQIVDVLGTHILSREHAPGRCSSSPQSQ